MTVAYWIAGFFILAGFMSLLFFRVRFRSKLPDARHFPVFPSLSEEVGRAAEEGNLIHITVGSGTLTGADALASVAALESMTALCDLAAAYDTPPVITTGDPTVYLLADDWMRRAYARLGNVERYRPALVQFIAASPVVYAAMAATYLYEKGVGSNVMLGAFDQEVSLIADAAVRTGAFSVGGAVSADGLGALYPALKPKRLVIGEELFAGAAVAGQQPVYWAGLWAQQLLRWVTIGVLILWSLLSLLGFKVN